MNEREREIGWMASFAFISKPRYPQLIYIHYYYIVLFIMNIYKQLHWTLNTKRTHLM